MNDTQHRGFDALPNELLYDILQSFTTKHVLTFAPVSRRFHSICVRILQNRLTVAATLLDHVLILELYPPSARLTAGKLFCTSLGTSLLDEESLESVSDSAKIGHLGKAVYSKFRPQHQEVRRPSLKHPAGDIPGSRTHPSSADPSIHAHNAESNLVSQQVSLDADELFTQLIATLMLVKPGPRPDTILTAVEVCEGTIRVWRDWLAKQNKANIDSTSSRSPADDPSTLWVNTADQAVGVKFRVKERKWKRDVPILVSADEEVAVSYTVDLEEVVLRTSHLLFMVEESLREQYEPLSRQLYLRPV
ncbi:unnamed protein product [Aureobasidium mustum]|uniref:F-box domain-containing protein n=1 Tax=Aureobasidium mustum TaxID=2773714 RepID=A0A9N8PL63_9PEZI|nr:unnamed protein product [Aureobasidium mustum]